MGGRHSRDLEEKRHSFLEGAFGERGVDHRMVCGRWDLHFGEGMAEDGFHIVRRAWLVALGCGRGYEWWGIVHVSIACVSSGSAMRFGERDKCTRSGSANLWVGGQPSRSNLEKRGGHTQAANLG